MSLRQVLWLDFAAGGSAALLGLAFCDSLAAWLGLPARLLLGISFVTGVYALGALRLATLAEVPRAGLRLLVAANWAWTAVSVGLVALFFDGASLLGQAYLVLQVLVVGGLAWVEGRFERLLRQRR